MARAAGRWVLVACLGAAACDRGAARAEREAAEAASAYAGYKARQAEEGAKRQGEVGAAEEADREKRAEALRLEREADAEKERERAERARPDPARDAAEAKARDIAAGRYEELLLQRQMNPESVRAGGPGKRTLVVRGWFCSRQHLYNLDHSDEVTWLKAAGFSRVECSNGLETWSGGL